MARNPKKKTKSAPVEALVHKKDKQANIPTREPVAFFSLACLGSLVKLMMSNIEFVELILIPSAGIFFGTSTGRRI